MHHEHGFVERPAHGAFRAPVGDCGRLKAQILIQSHFLRATPGNHQCNCFCSQSMMEDIQNEDKQGMTSLILALNRFLLVS